MSTTPGEEPPLNISEHFNASDADVLLVSSDNVGFRVHRANLCASSMIFKDMFEVGSEISKEGELPTIPLQEGATTLEVMLPYIYPTRMRSVALEQPALYEVIRALDKYGIERGMEAVLGCMVETTLASSSPAEASTLILLLALASHLGREHIQALTVKRLLRDHQLTPEELHALSRGPTEQLPASMGCFTKLRALLLKRQESLRLARETASTELAHSLRYLGEPCLDSNGYSYGDDDSWRTRSHAMAAAFFLWDAIREETTKGGLKEWEGRERGLWHALREDTGVEKVFLVAWAAQIEGIEALPDEL